MLKDEYKLNREIHKWEDNPAEPKVILLHEDDRIKLYYTKQHIKKDPNSNCWSQIDVLSVELKDKGLTITHKPRLDPYVSMENNIVSMTSDGECWVLDINTGKENSIPMPIVAFDHYIEFEDCDKFPNTFLISGSGCCWGCEADEQGFEIYIDKDTLEELDYNDWFYNDDWNDEDEEDSEE